MPNGLMLNNFSMQKQKVELVLRINFRICMMNVNNLKRRRQLCKR
jgi:hypothetical protein